MKLILLLFVVDSPVEVSKMKCLSYKDYVIMVANTKENKTWRSYVTVTWYAGKFDVDDDSCFTTEREAEEHGVELGKHWVNNRIQRMQRVP